MKRTLLLILVFIFSLSLVTLAYSEPTGIQQTLGKAVTNSATSACPVGSQLPATVHAKENSTTQGKPCGNGYIQGACCCKEDGSIGCPGNSVCIEALKNQRIVP